MTARERQRMNWRQLGRILVVASIFGALGGLLGVFLQRYVVPGVEPLVVGVLCSTIGTYLEQRLHRRLDDRATAASGSTTPTVPDGDESAGDAGEADDADASS